MTSDQVGWMAGVGAMARVSLSLQLRDLAVPPGALETGLAAGPDSGLQLICH